MFMKISYFFHRLIRIPFFARYTKPSDRQKPDYRDIEEIDPVFNIKRDNIVKFKKGPPIVLKTLINPDTAV